MSQLTRILFHPLPGLLVFLLAVPSASGDELGVAVQAAIRKVEPSIVRLRVIGGEQSIDGNDVRSLVTTGIVISEDGEILTSQFALEGKPEAVLIEDQTGKRTNAKIVATDSVRRIVLLKAQEGRWTPAVSAANDLPQVGQWSIALGRFYAAESSSVSVGIISALHRINGLAIQTDAKISPVNYGGPLITLSGGIVGILVPLSPRGGGSAASGIEWYDSGIGFAIPLRDALAAAEKLRSGKDLKPGRVGIRLVPAGAFDAKVVIDRVLPGGPADQAGLRKGDRVLAIDGVEVERSSVLMESLAGRYAGDSVAFRIRRGDEELTMPVELVESLPPMAEGYLGLLPIRLAKQKTSPDASAKETPEAGKERPLDIPRIELPGILQEKNPDAGDADDSVPLIVVNDSPAAAGNLPVSVELLSLNETKTTSIAALALAVEDVTAASVVKLEYRVPGESKIQTVELTAASRPDSVIELSDAVLAQIQRMRPTVAAADAGSKDAAAVAGGTSSVNDVARQEFNFEERGRCVVLTSSKPSPVMPGIVILLSAHETSEEEIVRRWSPYLHSHCLSVAIPQSPESARLTTEDIPLVLTTIRAMVSRSGADLQRVIVIADRTQSALAWQCSFGGPSTVRGIVLTDGWFSSSQVQGVDGAGHSVLLLDPTEGAQARALIDLSQKSQKAAGFWAPLPNRTRAGEGALENRDVRTIADWSLQIRSF